MCVCVLCCVWVGVGHCLYYVCACASACLCVCMCACVHTCVYVFICQGDCPPSSEPNKIPVMQLLLFSPRHISRPNDPALIAHCQYGCIWIPKALIQYATKRGGSSECNLPGVEQHAQILAVESRIVTLVSGFLVCCFQIF